MSFPHSWILPEEQTAELVAALTAAGAGARMKIKPYDKDGEKQLRFFALPADGTVVAEDGGGGTNNTIRCPGNPLCP